MTIKPFREWFSDKYGCPFPANVGDPNLYEVVIPRALEAMADYNEERLGLIADAMQRPRLGLET